MKKRINYIVLILLIIMSLNSCATVKPYEKMNINDPDMKLADRKSKKFHTACQVYREGASGGNGGKTGGGCGCN